MTIKQQVAYIMEHPFYAEAMRTPADMEILLFEVMCHTYLTVAGNCAKAFRGSKRMNFPQIVEAIRDVEPPVNLDVRLPFVPIREVAVVVPMQVAHRAELKIRYPKQPHPEQLKLWEIEKPPVVMGRLDLLEG